MRKSDPVHQLLHNAREVGSLESEGSFTIAGEVAIGKLASFQLPRRSAWILKVVQAAVRLKAPELRIRQSNQTTAFTFQPTVDFDVETLKEALLQPHISAPPGLENLAVGLRAVGFGDGRAFTLALDDGGTRTLLGWDGKRLAQRVENLAEPAPPAVHLGVAFPLDDLGRTLGGMMKSKGRATQEYLEVVQNGDACPIPLFFDGRRLDTLEAPPEEGVGSSAILSVGWAPPSPASPLAPLALPKGLNFKSVSSWKPTDRFTDGRIFHFDGDPRQAEAACFIKLRYSYHVKSHRSKHRSFSFQAVPRPSFLLFVKDGVVIQRRPASDDMSPVSYDLYLSADGLQTDISGFKLRQSPEFGARVAAAREHLGFQVENTIAALDEHTPRPFGVHTLMYGALGAVVTVAAPFAAAKVVYGAVALISLGLSAYDKKKIMDDCRFHLTRLARRLKVPEYH